MRGRLHRFVAQNVVTRCFTIRFLLDARNPKTDTDNSA